MKEETCKNCDGARHLGHDMTDGRPEHYNDGDCQTCPVKCEDCNGTGTINVAQATKSD